MNNTLEQALVIAIAEAFFNQKNYYTTNGEYITYGGQSVELVKKFLEDTNFKNDVGTAINAEIVKRKDEVVEAAFAQFRKQCDTIGEQAIKDYFSIKDYWSSYEQNLKSKAANIAQKYIEDHPGIEALVKEKIDGLIADKKISIQVNITVTGH